MMHIATHTVGPIPCGLISESELHAAMAAIDFGTHGDLPHPAPADDANMFRAAAIWDESVSPVGTIVETYLASRVIRLTPDIISADAIRFHHACPAGAGWRLPAMVARLTDIETGEPRGIHRTYLLPGGAGKAKDATGKSKAMLGPSKGAVIRLTANEDVTTAVGIAEGIETTLTVLNLGGGPVWACGSANTLSQFPVLDGIETLTVFADRGEAGEGAAEKARARWFEAGRETLVKLPIGNDDFNSAIQGIPDMSSATIDTFTAKTVHFAPDEARDTFLNAERDNKGEIPPNVRTNSPKIKATPFVVHEIPPRDWIYGQRLIRKFVSATIAPGGVGKSSLVAVDALAMASGRCLVHEAPFEPLRVWLWNGEDPLEETERRLVAAMRAHSVTEDDLGGRLFVGSGRDTPIRIAETVDRAATIAMPEVDALIAEITARKIDVLIIDPFVQVHGVAENDNGAIDQVVKTFALIADRTGCAIELVHHTRKANGTEADIDSARGASAMAAAVRSARALNVMDAKAAANFGIDPEKRGSYVRIDDVKSNLAPAGAAKWFQKANVPLANGTADRAEDWVGVVLPWSPPSAMAGMPDDAYRIVRAAVAGKGFRKDVRASNWVGRAIGTALGLNPENPADRAKITALIAGMLRSGELVVVTVTDDKAREKDGIDVGNNEDDRLPS